MDKQELKTASDWFTETAWPQLFAALSDKPDEAELVTWICDCLIEILESGKDGLLAALESLNEGIRIGHPFTESGKLAVEQYRLSVKNGYVDEWHRTILEGSIERIRERAAKKSIRKTGTKRKAHLLPKSETI